MTVALPLALIGDLGLQELMLVAVAAVMIFGKRLPEVAGQAFAQFQKVRRTLSQMWRDTGIDEELRRIQRDVDRDVPRHRRLSASPRKPPLKKPDVGQPETPPEPSAGEQAARRAWRPVSEPDPYGSAGSAPADPAPVDSAPAAEPAASAEPQAGPELEAGPEPASSEQATTSSPGEARREP